MPNHCIFMNIVIPISYPPNISWNWLRGIYLIDEKLHHGLMFLPFSCRNLCTHKYRKHPLGISTYHQKMKFFLNLMHSGLIRGHSTTTWTKFWPPLPRVDKSRHFTYYLPHYQFYTDCKVYFWMHINLWKKHSFVRLRSKLTNPWYLNES